LHSDVLTDQEHASRGLHGEFRKRLKPGFRVLDWGCGRGSDVLHLRSMGIDAYGAEISQETIDKGKPLFDERGIDHAATIKPISAQNRTAYPDASFDMIVSYQVLEHICDLPTAAAEIARLLRPGGISVHLYPGHRRIVEGHLFMPFVHWLPKNKLRYWAIVACTLAHVEPRGGWYNIANSPVTVRAKRYFDFSVNSTYYRPPRRVAQVFRSAGLVPRFESHLHDRVRGTLLAKIPGAMLNRLLCTFASCVFIAAKEPAR
jgi:SAM-dependent methyltransferase